jgi:hypothetical protein
MKTWKSKILIAALALTASPAVAQQQGTPSLQSAPPAASARSQEQTQTSPSEQNRNRRRRHHRRRHRRRNHRPRRNSVMMRNFAEPTART